MLDYKGLRDCHLNIYWQYEGKPHLENNITKAFINSIDGLSLNGKKKVLKILFGIEIVDDDVRFEFYLLKKPDGNLVNSFPINNRLMFAFSPEGECWGFSGQDNKDERRLYDSIKLDLSKNIQDEEALKSETEKALKEFLEGERGDSIPDAWILIYTKGKADYIIALENKLHKLDPNQINNHIEKSLLLLNNKPTVIYKKYRDIAVTFVEINEFNSNQFVEYLTILGYLGVNEFNLACSSDVNIRQRLMILFGKTILSKIHDGTIDERKWNVFRVHVSYAYLREINLILNYDNVKISLAFGPTQNSGKKMMQTIETIALNQDHLSEFHQSFHLLYQRGRNIGNSYVDFLSNINDYIKYWKENIDLIRTYNPNEAINLYKKMFDDGVIPLSNYERLKNQLTGKKNPVLVVPEIIIEYSWFYDELSIMGLEDFVNIAKSKIDEALIAMRLK